MTSSTRQHTREQLEDQGENGEPDHAETGWTADELRAHRLRIDRGVIEGTCSYCGAPADLDRTLRCAGCS